MAKKKYRLKKGPKVFLVLLVVFCVLGYFGYTKYQEYVYHQSAEYKLLTLGYTKEDVELFESKLNEKELDNLVTYEYNEFIPSFVKEKYFLYKNLEKYLSKVITKDQDFFKYKGVEGYKYDNIVAQVNTRAVDTPYENPTNTDLSKGYAILVNKYNSLGIEYEPDDLVDIPIKYYYGSAKKIRQEAYDAFVEMWEAANQEGIYLVIVSAYRNGADQKEAYDYYANLKGTTYADSIAARPGFSEHQTGLALDIYSKGNTVAETFKDSNAYKWLINNCYKYGFILRYPEAKSTLTGYNYESWHYRYVGKELAQKVHDEGITYDEYYAFYLDK